MGSSAAAALRAISDLHVSSSTNRQVLKEIEPETPSDWLIVAGDIAEKAEDIEWALGLLASKFAKVVWTPGNHDLWTVPHDRVTLTGVERYWHLVDMCRSLGVVTPEDPYSLWEGADGPVAVAPLFLLYDYSFRPPGTSAAEALGRAYDAGVVCTDEIVLRTDPYPSIVEWCHTRVDDAMRRLAAHDPEVPLVLVNHYPLVRYPTKVLHYPEFALWCGTERSEDFHVRYNVRAVVYGHLHIPRVTWHDGVPFMEVSLGYPREWSARGEAPMPRAVLQETRGPDVR